MELTRPMSNNNNNNKNRPKKDQDITSDETVQNTAPVFGWSSFDHFWSSCVKNGTPSIKSSCIAHLKATNRWQDQSKWVEGCTHFGIPIEK